MPVTQIDFGTPQYHQTVQLRYEILRKPLKLEFTEQQLQKEKDDIHIAAYDDGHLLGCCILTQIDNETVRLRQMAVQKNKQQMGIGATLMRYAQNVAADKGYKVMMMHARKDVVRFYEKLGFTITGEEFTEVTLPHFRMEKRMDGYHYA